VHKPISVGTRVYLQLKNCLAASIHSQ
jgi:hypothetical protein